MSVIGSVVVQFMIFFCFGFRSLMRNLLCFVTVQSALVISNSKGLFKHFEISVARYIRVAELRKTTDRTKTFNKWICNLPPEVTDILKILWKRGEIAPAPEEQFLLFSTIFCYLLLDFYVKTGTKFSLRDKRLFEITRVNCICDYVFHCNASLMR